MTEPEPFSWAPVTIVALPSALSLMYAPDGPGALNHQPSASPLPSPAGSGAPQ